MQTPTPQVDRRYDEVGHWPKPEANKNQCRLCKKTVRMSCMKCAVYLCLQSDRNCFYAFHRK